MLEFRRDSGLAKEAIPHRQVADKFGANLLEGDLPAQELVMGQRDTTETSGRKCLDDADPFFRRENFTGHAGPNPVGELGELSAQILEPRLFSAQVVLRLDEIDCRARIVGPDVRKASEIIVRPRNPIRTPGQLQVDVRKMDHREVPGLWLLGQVVDQFRGPIVLELEGGFHCNLVGVLAVSIRILARLHRSSLREPERSTAGISGRRGDRAEPGLVQSTSPSGN